MNRMMKLSLACLFALLHGCSASYPNLPLERFDTSAGYRFDTLSTGSKNSDDVFVCLTFSGGGTRAAAFAYGVLIGLRDTPITEGGSRRLLDEVDLISSVSGGSFTAMAYALWGDEAFDGRFEEKFLRNDIERVERRQDKAGRLDFLLADPDADVRYEVELQLGVQKTGHKLVSVAMSPMKEFDAEHRRPENYSWAGRVCEPSLL